MTDERDIAIRVQSSAHDAAQIYAALVQPGEAFDPDAFNKLHLHLFAHISGIIEDEVNANQQEAVANLQQAFPGSTVEPTPPPNPADTYGAPPVPAGPSVAYAPPQAPQTGVWAPQPAPTMFPTAPPQQTFPTQQQQPYPAPAPTQQQYPPQPVPQAPPMPGVRCPKCGGDAYDNRQDNQRKRAYGFKLGADVKCKNKQCGGVIWPDDYQAYAQAPLEPRR